MDRYPSTPSCRSEKRECPDLDASPRACIGGRGRVFKGGVGGPAGAAVLRRIVNLENDGFVAALAWEPVPAMCGIVRDRIGLADPVGGAPFGHNEVFRRQAL